MPSNHALAFLLVVLSVSLSQSIDVEVDPRTGGGSSSTTTDEEAFKSAEMSRITSGKKRGSSYELNARTKSNNQFKLEPTGVSELYRTAPIFTKGKTTLTDDLTISMNVKGKDGIKVGFQGVNKETGYTEEYMIQLEAWRNSWSWLSDAPSSKFKYTNWFKGSGFIQGKVIGKSDNIEIGIQREGSMEMFKLNLEKCCESGTCIPRDDRPDSRGGKVMLKWDSDQRTVQFMTTARGGYPIFKKTSSWIATDRVRFIMKIREDSWLWGTNDGEIKLEDAPQGSCGCDDDSCLPRESCVKEGGELTLKFNTSTKSSGFSLAKQGSTSRFYTLFSDVNIARLDEVRIVAEIDDGSEISNLFVQDEETVFVVKHLNKGASQQFSGGSYDPEYCYDESLKSGARTCSGATSTCCGFSELNYI